MNTKIATLFDLPEEEFVHPGNRSCAGCGLSQTYRIGLKAIGRDAILVVPPSCLTVLQGLYPIAATQLPCLNVTFASTAAAASGVSAALRALGREHTAVVAWAGDGGTSDIGLQALSGACERGENFIYICYDNEAYMNTGVQRSGTTPQGAVTTTTPIYGKKQPRKDLPQIVAAHGIDYVASCSSAFPLDFYTKLLKAKSLPGVKYFHVNAACPPGWGFEPRYTVKVGRLAVETGLVELYEIESGKKRLSAPSAKLLKGGRKPVKLYFEAQARFKKINPETVAKIQEEIDLRWADLENA